MVILEIYHLLLDLDVLVDQLKHIDGILDNIQRRCPQVNTLFENL